MCQTKAMLRGSLIFSPPPLPGGHPAWRRRQRHGPRGHECRGLVDPLETILTLGHCYDAVAVERARDFDIAEPPGPPAEFDGEAGCFIHECRARCVGVGAAVSQEGSGRPLTVDQHVSVFRPACQQVEVEFGCEPHRARVRPLQPRHPRGTRSGSRPPQAPPSRPVLSASGRARQDGPLFPGCRGSRWASSWPTARGPAGPQPGQVPALDIFRRQDPQVARPGLLHLHPSGGLHVEVVQQ